MQMTTVNNSILDGLKMCNTELSVISRSQIERKKMSKAEITELKTNLELLRSINLQDLDEAQQFSVKNQIAEIRGTLSEVLTYVPKPIYRETEEDFIKDVREMIIEQVLSNFFLHLHFNKAEYFYGISGAKYNTSETRELLYSKIDVITNHMIHAFFSQIFRNTEKTGFTLAWSKSYLDKYGSSRNNVNKVIRIIKDMPIFALRSTKSSNNYAERVAVNPFISLSISAIMLVYELRKRRVFKVDNSLLNDSEIEHMSKEHVRIVKNLTRVSDEVLDAAKIPTSLVKAFNNVYDIMCYDFKLEKLGIRPLMKLIKFNNSLTYSDADIKLMYENIPNTYVNVSEIVKFNQNPVIKKKGLRQ